MPLTSLDISNLRNIEKTVLHCHSSLNVIVGANGSGKTSLLEAIYLLGRGRSFRTSSHHSIIQNGQKEIFIVGKTTEQSAQFIGIHISDGNLKAKANGQYLSKSSQLALILPLLMISPDADKLILGSPKQRRRFIDWGLFHVEQGYLTQWKRYNRVLTQRNTLLRQGACEETRHWDEQLITHANKLTQARMEYCIALEEIFQAYLALLTSGLQLDLSYRPGWSADETFSTALSRGLERDIKSGFTQKGPHRADLYITTHNRKAASYLSGGQQKLAACALILAQAKLLNERLGNTGVLLVDDLPAELDLNHRQNFLALLRELGSQLFVTTTEESLLPLDSFPNYSVFHVEHGQVSAIKKT